MSHDKMIAAIKENNLCMNCLKSGHFSKQCSSLKQVPEMSEATPYSYSH